MQRRRWRPLLALILSLSLSSGPPSPAAGPSPASPRVILIVADDLGYMDLKCNNDQSFYETPNLDRLAARGMRFRAGYAACPVCSPTRAAIMTGRVPPRTGITDFIGGTRTGTLRPAPYFHQLFREEVTLAERLREAGYATFFAGKWHLGDGNFSPNHQGFGPDLTGGGQFYYPPGSSSSAEQERDDPKSTERITDAAIRFIAANRDRPFFAYLPYPAVHIPVGAKAELIKKYERKRQSLPAVAEAQAWGAERQQRVRLVQDHAAYAAMLEQLDSAVGRLLEAVDRAGIAEQTVIIFTSDNGGLSTAEGHPTSNMPLRAGKGWVYEGGIRVPWIVAAPGVTSPGGVCDTPVVSMDLFPTILELAGLPLAPALHRDGVSIVPLLRGTSIDQRPLFWHYPHYSNQGGPPSGAVREGDWKLVEGYEDHRLELYNLRDDPGERRDVQSREPARARAMQERLAAWRKDVNALMPTPFDPAR
ncbi:MAG: sulfatase [Isosphaeraceae bacterium]